MEVLPIKTAEEKTVAIRAAVTALKRGEVVVYPTETSYGLGVDATSKSAVVKARRLKGRGVNPITVVASSVSMVRKYFIFDAHATRLVKQYWPGPLTVIIPVKDSLMSKSGLSEDGVGVRVPGSKFARSLVRALGKPITSTSANRSGHSDCYSLSDFEKQFRGLKKPKLFLDAGSLPKRKPSTVVSMKGDSVQVFRSGSIKLRK